MEDLIDPPRSGEDDEDLPPEPTEWQPFREFVRLSGLYQKAPYFAGSVIITGVMIFIGFLLPSDIRDRYPVPIGLSLFIVSIFINGCVWLPQVRRLRHVTRRIQSPPVGVTIEPYPLRTGARDLLVLAAEGQYYRNQKMLQATQELTATVSGAQQEIEALALQSVAMQDDVQLSHLRALDQHVDAARRLTQTLQALAGGEPPPFPLLEGQERVALPAPEGPSFSVGPGKHV